CNEIEVPLPVLNLSHLLQLDFTDLQHMDKDFRPVETPEIQLERINDFDESLDAILARLDFKV
ncbi:MAG: hypothetical protein AB1489_18915, partial [Acidobacteriota bacterium]